MKKIFLILILILASGLRLWNLAASPSGLNADEAALGYNAYSLINTGRDEHGHPWPVNLESFGDFKPAGYAYVLIPFVKLIGLNEFAVRLPSALFGILSVFLIYLLAKDIFDENVGLVSALILAISPWHLHFSRGGWEVNVATTIILAAVYCFSRWIQVKKLVWMLGFGLLLILSMYFYQSARVLAPVLGFVLFISHWRDFIKYHKQTLTLIVASFLIVLPLAWSIVKSDAGSRLNGVGLLADIGPINRANELRGHYNATNPPIYAKIFYNKITGYTIQFIQNYLVHFDGNFLFVNGDAIERNKVPETGLLYIFEFIPLGFGIYQLVKSASSKKYLIWVWLLISPIASAMTFQVPHALRAQNMVIPLAILIALGWSFLIKKSKYILILIIPLYGFFFVRYLHEYYVHYPKAYPAAWEYGFSQLVQQIDPVESQYTKIYVSDRYDQPYILFLFYKQYAPQLFQGHHTLTFRDKFNFSTVREFDKYHFEKIDFEKIKDEHNILVVTTEEKAPSEYKAWKVIYFPNQQPAFTIYIKS